ncbi:hypothetical protein GW915_03300 [bacterium]|nr:hypothetical protein [bacterium]
MPRKKLIYTSDYPYHVMSRSNNKEWFYISQVDMWRIFNQQLQKMIQTHGLLVHAYVLMSNHYHMVVSVSEASNLGVVMRDFQRNIAKIINKKTGRVNHVFGGPYKACLITTCDDYARVLKYVYRNPVEARVTEFSQDYSFSSLTDPLTPLCSPASGIASKVPNRNCFDWLAAEEGEQYNFETMKGLMKTKFKESKRSECCKVAQK